MSWETFAGDLSDAFLATFHARAAKDGVQQTASALATYFRSHLERGVQQLGRKHQPASAKGMIVLCGLASYGLAATQTAAASPRDNHEQGV